VGWRTSAHHLTELPLDALEMALWVRPRAGQNGAGVIHHSDAGSEEYTTIRYRNRLAAAEALALASIGTAPFLGPSAKRAGRPHRVSGAGLRT